VTRTYRILIGVVLLAAAGAAYWMLLLAPKRVEARDLSTKVADAQAQLAVAQANVASYQHAEQSYRKNYETVVRLGKAVPADDDTRSLMVQVDSAAKRSGIGFDNIDLVAGASTAPGSNVATATSTIGRPPGAVNAGALSVMPFQLSFSGEFRTISRFFSRLERFVTLDGDKLAVNGRLLRVERLSLKPVDGGWPAIQAQIGVSAYVSPSTDATATAPAGAAATGATATGATTTTPPTTTSDLR
jgi:Tfp pilus assembly protein PilO